MKIILPVFPLLLSAVAQASVMGSANYSIDNHVFGNAGAPMASVNHSNDGTLGHPAIVGLKASTNYMACSGYWCEAPFWVQTIYDLISGDADYDGRVILSDAQRALSVLLDMGQCAYPMAAASPDFDYTVKDVMLIGQYAYGARVGSGLGGLTGGFINLTKSSGDGQNVEVGTTALIPLTVQCDSATAGFCPNVADIAINYEAVGACATLQNLDTGETGFAVTADILDEVSRLSQEVEVTAEFTPGDCDIDAHVQFLDPDGANLGEARVTFTLTLGNPG